MEKTKRRALESAGFRFGDAGDFLELTAEERGMVELRLALSRVVRKKRIAQRLKQQDLARRVQSSQSRVAKIEAGTDGVSLDLSFRGLFALGGKLSDLSPRAAVLAGGNR